MADNTTLQTTTATPPSGLVVATRQASHAGDTADLQLITLAAATGSEGSRTVREVLIQDDAAFTPGTDAVLMLGAHFDDTSPDSVDEGDAGALRMSSRRELYVQLRDAAGNERGLNVDASGNATVNVTGTVTADVTGQGDVPITLDSEAVVLGAGSAAIGKLAANSGVDIGDVDILSLPSDTFVAEDGSLGKGVLLQGDDGTDRKNVAVDTSGLLQVDIAADAVGLLTSSNFAAAFGTAGSADSQVMSVQGIASMTPLLVDATGQGDVPVTLDSEAVVLGAGTAEIGSLLPPDTDVTAHTNYARKYYTASTPTDGIIWSPAAGKRWHVCWIWIQTSADSTIILEDDKSGGDDPVWKGEIAAKSGAFMVFPDQYPMASGEDAADLTITSSAGTVYVSCGGYEI